jgi:hypothetical protein
MKLQQVQCCEWIQQFSVTNFHTKLCKLYASGIRENNRIRLSPYGVLYGVGYHPSGKGYLVLPLGWYPVEYPLLIVSASILLTARRICEVSYALTNMDLARPEWCQRSKWRDFIYTRCRHGDQSPNPRLSFHLLFITSVAKSSSCSY